jgi:hypothetical protein
MQTVKQRRGKRNIEGQDISVTGVGNKNINFSQLFYTFLVNPFEIGVEADVGFDSEGFGSLPLSCDIKLESYVRETDFCA